MFGKDLADKLHRAWQAAQALREQHSYVVYMPRADAYALFRLKAEATDAAIHNTVAHRENNHPTRHYAGIVKPGSFNFVRVEAADDLAAVERARAAGLEWEPIKTVLARHINGREDARRTEEAGGDIAESLRALEKAVRDLGKPRP